MSNSIQFTLQDKRLDSSLRSILLVLGLLLLITIQAQSQEVLTVKHKLIIDKSKLVKRDSLFLKIQDSLSLRFAGSFGQIKVHVKIGKIDIYRTLSTNEITGYTGTIYIPPLKSKDTIEIIIDSSERIIIPFIVGYQYIHINNTDNRKNNYEVVFTNKWIMYR